MGHESDAKVLSEVDKALTEIAEIKGLKKKRSLSLLGRTTPNQIMLLDRRKLWAAANSQYGFSSTQRIKASKANRMYTMVRFLCSYRSAASAAAESTAGQRGGMRPFHDDLALSLLRLIEALLSTLPQSSFQCRYILAPVCRLLGMICATGTTTLQLRGILNLVASPPAAASSGVRRAVSVPTPVRLYLIRALTYAAEGGSKSGHLTRKAGPDLFFSFGRGHGLVRKFSSTEAAAAGQAGGGGPWPFRTDFGMSCWFRVEQFHCNTGARGRKEPTLLSVRTVDGAGVVISFEVISSHNGGDSAATLIVTTLDSSTTGLRAVSSSPAQSVRLRGCVLSPRLWYHVSVRLTRPRLKGYLTLALKDEVSILLDGKLMLTEPLKFPKVSGGGGVAVPSPIIASSSKFGVGSAGVPFTVKFANNFDGQTGALYVFKDYVSDATLLSLFELTSIKCSTKSTTIEGDSSDNDNYWDSQNGGSLAGRVNTVGMKLKPVDMDEIVVGKPTTTPETNEGTPPLSVSAKAVLDLSDDDDVDSVATSHPELSRTAFRSRLFLVWDPNRECQGYLVETHCGASVSMDGGMVVPWRVNGAKEVIGNIGGVSSLLPLFKTMLSGDVERRWIAEDNYSKETVHPSSDVDEEDCRSLVIPTLLSLLSAFIRDHEDNAREMLRCGGIEIVEQCLLQNKAEGDTGKTKQSARRIFSVTSSVRTSTSISKEVVDAISELRLAASHNLSLETKIFSRLLFNAPLWLGGISDSPGVALHAALLPCLSTLARSLPNKVRECVGIKEIVELVKEYTSVSSINVSKPATARIMS